MNKRKKLLAAGLAAIGSLAVAAVPAARAFQSWKAQRRQARIAEAWASIRAGQDYLSWNPVEDDNEAEDATDRRVPEQDDPMLRGLANAAQWGYRSSTFLMQKLAVVRAEAAKWPELMPAAPAPLAARRRIDGNAAAGFTSAAPAIAAPRWISLGPTDVAKPEYNGDEYVANDTGRIATIKIDPLNANIVYVAENGGGIWRTTNFNDATPAWAPLTDSLGEMGMGCMELAPGPDSDHHTLWAGLGDINEGTPGGVVFWSRDSGATWNGPIQLAAQYPGDPQPSTVATRVRDVRVDPNNPDVVLAATDVGLFRSTNGTSTTPTFSLIDLPNAGGASLKEAIWSFAYLGAASGGSSNWLVSGVAATPNATAYANLPPGAGAGTATTLGDIWKSTDGGATWTSLRNAGLVSSAALGLAQDLGRMTLAPGTPVARDPTQTVVYVQAGNANEASPVQIATLKTSNSGTNWSVVATTASKPTNPTLNSDCNTMNVGHNQTWYNEAIAVDPSNSNNVVQGGNLCAVRSIDGGATWQAVTDWLPLPRFAAFGINQGNTANGVYLPYVHADWHALTIANGTVIAGTDGGVFSSTNVFDPTITPTNMPVTWRQVNTGLVTHLHYSIASGDPVTGNQRFAFTGLQDNGTRMRDTGASTKWNQVVGGDGVAAAISLWSDASHQVFFHSLPGRRDFCRPGEPFFIAGSFDPAVARDCNSGLLHPNQGPDTLATEWTTWNPVVNVNLPNGDSEPFLLRIIPVNDGKGTMFTNSTQYAWKMTIDDKDVVNYQQISNIFANRTATPAAAVRSPRGMLQVSQWTYTTKLPDGAPSDSSNRTIVSRLYGVPLSGGWFYIGVENSFDQSNRVQQPWSWTSSQTIVGTGLAQQMTSTSSIDFPHDPTHLGGAAPVFPTDLLNTYIVSSVTPLDVANQLIRDDVGRIFKTTNNGVSWTSIATVARGMPNIPVNIVRFDPSDTTDQTIWAGTDIGVYRTTDGGAHWARYGAGLPMVRVTDMAFARNSSLIRVATYGRGIWEIYPNTEARPVNGNGDWDVNGQIDFLDLAALASRLGRSASDPDPAQLDATRYDYRLDFTAKQSIDEDDLRVLLSRYGSNP